ncbi:MAG: hypothetical protein QOJ86_5202 [Bradyrhizobium sp.]|nr:hypothetical protein [Bradyrhizobium sp.]
MRGVGQLRRGWVTLSALMLAGLLLSGCNSIEGGPPRLFTVDYEAAVARDRVTGWETGYYTASATKVGRNEIIAARMREIDSYYYAFEASLIRERQELGFVSSIVSLGLTGAIPLAASLGTKSALGAASTFVQGGTKAFSDEVLFQKTVQVLATQMRAQRAFVGADIIDRMRRLDTDAYPLSMALGDLDEYYAAGTIAGALIEIQKTVGAKSTAGEVVKAEMMRGGAFRPNEDTVKRVLRYFNVAASIRATRLANMRTCLFNAGFKSGSGGPPDPLLFLGSNATQLFARQAMINCAAVNGDPM